MARRFFDVRHPMFRPLWIRALITAATLGWAGFEFLLGGPFWGILFGAMGVFLLYEFFIVFDPANYEKPPE